MAIQCQFICRMESLPLSMSRVEATTDTIVMYRYSCIQSVCFANAGLRRLSHLSFPYFDIFWKPDAREGLSPGTPGSRHCASFYSCACCDTSQQLAEGRSQDFCLQSHSPPLLSAPLPSFRFSYTLPSYPLPFLLPSNPTNGFCGQMCVITDP